MNSTQDMMEDLDMESYLAYEGVDFRRGYGQSGLQLNIRECPFCGGNSWKVYMNADSGLGNCFHGSCGQTFNKFTFIRALLDADNSTAFKAIRDYLRMAGWRPVDKRAAVSYQQSDVLLPEIEQIVPGTEAFDYLARRGFGDREVLEFGLTFSRDGSIPITRSDGTPGTQSFFHRIIIPILDLEGKLKTFQGRDITGNAEQKYLFPRGYPASGRFLYNAHAEIGKESVVVGEGVFDVIAIKAAIYADPAMADKYGAVGTFGKHLSKNDMTDNQDQYGEFLRMKRAGLRRVIFMWDSERSALRAAIKAAMSLVGIGLQASVVQLPAGKDPNEVDPSVVRSLINSARPSSYSKLAAQLAVVSTSLT